MDLMSAETILTVYWEAIGLTVFLCPSCQQLRESLPISSTREEEIQEEEKETVFQHWILVMFHLIISLWKWLLTERICVSVRHQKTRKKRKGRCLNHICPASCPGTVHAVNNILLARDWILVLVLTAVAPEVFYTSYILFLNIVFIGKVNKPAFVVHL